MGTDRQYPATGFDAVLSGRLIEPVFQPVVALVDERPVGFEALARGPEGRFHGAEALFAAAARAGRCSELDWLCATTSSRRYREADLPGMALFLNLNPDTLAADPPDDVYEEFLKLTQDQPVVVEITEQSVMREPGRLLDAIYDARSRTSRIALDDIGAEPAGLAAMPLINPDIIKLDRSIIQSSSNSWAVSQVVNAVLDEAQRRGAQILAEGIERREHVEIALSLGATLGQGWLFGRPGPLPKGIRPSEQQMARVESPNVSQATPFEALATPTRVHPTSGELFATMAAHIENQATQTTNPAILAVNVGDSDFEDDARLRYGFLTNKGVYVFVLGTHVREVLGGQVRGIRLAGTDPLAHERTVLFVGSRYGSSAFARRHTSDPNDDSWDAGTCYDTDRVIEAMLTLVTRLPV